MYKFISEIMETMVLHSNSKENMTLIALLAKKLGVSVDFVETDNDHEDTILLNQMTKARELGMLNHEEKESFLDVLKKDAGR